jgi:hypothetical protein
LPSRRLPQQTKLRPESSVCISKPPD